MIPISTRCSFGCQICIYVLIANIDGFGIHVYCGSVVAFFFLLVETDYDSVLESGQHLSRAQSQSSKEKMGNSTFAYCTNHIHSLPSL